MAKKRASAGAGARSAKRSKGTISPASKKRKEDVAVGLATSEDGLVVETRSRQEAKEGRGNSDENCNEEPKKGPSAGLDRTFHTQCRETHKNSQSIDCSPAVEGQQNTDSVISQTTDSFQGTAKPLIQGVNRGSQCGKAFNNSSEQTEGTSLNPEIGLEGLVPAGVGSAPERSREALAGEGRSPADEQQTASVESGSTATGNPDIIREAVGLSGCATSVRAEPVTTVQRLGPIKGVSILNDGDASVSNWESWFVEFERRLLNEVPRIPKNRWVEQLEAQVAGRAERSLNIAKTQAALTNLENDYEVIRDLMLTAEGDTYHVKRYAKNLYNIEKGSLSAGDLYVHMFELGEYYERARKRALKYEGVNFPELPWGTVSFLYNEALPLYVRDTPTFWDASEAAKEGFFHELGMRCMMRERIVRKAATPDPSTRAGMETVDQEAAGKPIIVQTAPVKEKENKAQTVDKPASSRGGKSVAQGSGKKSGRFRCMHCGEKGHFLQDCLKWKRFTEGNPEKARNCPKCLEAGHSFRFCKDRVGKCWRTSSGAESGCISSTSPKTSKALMDERGVDDHVRLESSNSTPRNLADMNPREVVPQEADRSKDQQERNRREKDGQTQMPTTQRVPRALEILATADNESEVKFLRLALERAKARLRYRMTWTAEKEQEYRKASADYMAYKSEEYVRQARDDSAQMTSSPRTVANLYVPVLINGSEELALLDTGSARTLLDARSFQPSTLTGFTPATSKGDELLDASGNRISTVGKWHARVQAAEYGGCIVADVLPRCPVKAVLGVDALRVLRAAIVFTESDVELRVGGWRAKGVKAISVTAVGTTGLPGGGGLCDENNTPVGDEENRHRVPA